MPELQMSTVLGLALAAWFLLRHGKRTGTALLRAMPKNILPWLLLTAYYTSTGGKLPESGKKTPELTTRVIAYNKRSPWMRFCVRAADAIFAAMLVVRADEWIAEVPVFANSILRYKNKRDHEDSNAMQYGTFFNLLNMLKFAIRLEQKYQRVTPPSRAECRKTRSYNLKDNIYELGSTPVFSASTAEAIQLLLDAGFDDLELRSKNRENMPLLHFCIARGVLNASLYQKLQNQAHLKWKGYNPIQYAMSLGDYSSFKLLSRGRDYCRLIETKLGPETWGLFRRHGRDTKRLAIFLDLAKCSSCMRLMKRSRKRIVLETCRGGHVRLLASVIRHLSVMPEDIAQEKGRTSPLWICAHHGQNDILQRLLSVEGIFADTEARDGTTAFDMAMGHMNDLTIKLLLESPVTDPKDHMLELLGRLFLSNDKEALILQSKAPNAADTIYKMRNDCISASLKQEENRNVQVSNRRNRASDISGRYPYVNEETEMQWSFNASALGEYFKCDPKTKKFHKPVIGEERYGIYSPRKTFKIEDDVVVAPCPNDMSYETKISYSIMRDLLFFSKELEQEFQKNPNDIWSSLLPKLSLAGSVAEGTRIGIASELDITMDFTGWHPSLRVRRGDPFQLFTTKAFPKQLAKYRSKQGEFIHQEFLHDLLKKTEQIVTDIFEEGRNPAQLQIITKNEVLKRGVPKCSECKARLLTSRNKQIFQQCPTCAYTVSQTKAGICLQFEWKSERDELVFCSMDIVPAYSIEEIDSIKLARIINAGILQKFQPVGWLKYIRNYIECDMVLEDLVDVKTYIQKNESVFLKLLHPETDVYYIRPGQLLGKNKFVSKRHHLLYQQIKFFKKSFKVDMNMYMMKKLLWKPEVTMFHYETVMQREFVLKVLSLPELRHHFEAVFDFPMFEKKNAVDIFFHPQFP